MPVGPRNHTVLLPRSAPLRAAGSIRLVGVQCQASTKPPLSQSELLTGKPRLDHLEDRPRATESQGLERISDQERTGQACLRTREVLQQAGAPAHALLDTKTPCRRRGQVRPVPDAHGPARCCAQRGRCATGRTWARSACWACCSAAHGPVVPGAMHGVGVAPQQPAGGHG